MKKLVVYFLSLVGLSALLVACSSQSTAEKNWETIQKRGSIKVATAGTLYPQTYHDDKGNLTGYDVEILKEVGKRLNLKIDFTEMGVDGMLTAVTSGQVDIANYSLEDDNKNVKKFLRSEPYKYSFTSMVVRASDDSGIHSWKDLKGKKAAGAASTKYMKIAKKMGADLVVYDNVTNDVYMQDLVNGRTDVIVNDYYLQKMAVAAVKDKYAVKINDGLYSNPYTTSFTFSLKNKVLQEKVNQAIKSMKKDGTLSKISKQFFAGQDVTQKTKVDYTDIDISDID
ncbi:transporter substrate-binding domain-containing protein [Streptococcus sp. DD12]|uniref:transporter substrate-binding domain-containing protein n=1 Tax=Streptococcus sp. DD12 TaxID=1777880 RepID=UPI000792E006|nr:transporter substrate-binding domain-containing protein [Streptococcus sp. DD12]KXT76923.1 Cystine ABC transporter, periplasmic cystine-binding protein FliY [Streptococcus sp. DD12]